jgi:3-phenylpropionate/trans-cinnamate dioxygenase ferredoxin subunit
MNESTVSWHFCASSESLPEAQLQEHDINGRRIGLLRRAGKVFAFSALCPHSGGRLCDGWLDPKGRIVCPDHKYRFEPSNGYNASGEGYKLKTFPVREEEGRIFVQF